MLLSQSEILIWAFCGLVWLNLKNCCFRIHGSTVVVTVCVWLKSASLQPATCSFCIHAWDYEIAPCAWLVGTLDLCWHWKLHFTILVISSGDILNAITCNSWPYAGSFPTYRHCAIVKKAPSRTKAIVAIHYLLLPRIASRSFTRISRHQCPTIFTLRWHWPLFPSRWKLWMICCILVR